MVRTREQRTMDRARMERLSIEQLKEEAQLLHLPTTGDKKSLIEAILVHWEKNETGGPGEQPVTVGAESPTGEVLLTVLSSVNDILQHQREAQRQQEQFLERQHRQFEQLVQLLARREEMQTEHQRSPTRTTDGNDQSTENQVNPIVTATSDPAPDVRATVGTSSGNAVAWLASQIPEFGGAEEDNIRGSFNK